MLFHLKEPDYTIIQDFPNRIYGRSSEQILKFLDFYTERHKKRKQEHPELDDADLVWWLKRKFSVEDIEQVEKGFLHFLTGMIDFSEEVKNKPLFEEISVADDFTLYVPEENIGNLLIWRMDLLNKERGGLYKLTSPAITFKNRAFVPEDITRAIMLYNFDSYAESIQKEIQKRAELSKHPGIKVDGLQKFIEAQARAKHITEEAEKN